MWYTDTRNKRRDSSLLICCRSSSHWRCSACMHTLNMELIKPDRNYNFLKRLSCQLSLDLLSCSILQHRQTILHMPHTCSSCSASRALSTLPWCSSKASTWSSRKLICRSGGVKDHIFLATRVNRNINYIFETLTSRAMDWYKNELILRGSGGGGGQGGLQNFTGPLSRKIKYIFGILSTKPSRLALVGRFD